MAVIEATGSLPKPAFSVSAQTREAPAVMHSQARPAMPASASGAAAEWTSQPAAGTAAGTSPSHAHPDAVLSSVSPASRPPIRPSSPDRHAPAAHASNRLRPSLPLDPRELKITSTSTRGVRLEWQPPDTPSEPSAAHSGHDMRYTYTISIMVHGQPKWQEVASTMLTKYSLGGQDMDLSRFCFGVRTHHPIGGHSRLIINYPNSSLPSVAYESADSLRLVQPPGIGPDLEADAAAAAPAPDAHARARAGSATEARHDKAAAHAEARDRAAGAPAEPHARASCPPAPARAARAGTSDAGEATAARPTAVSPAVAGRPIVALAEPDVPVPLPERDLTARPLTLRSDEVMHALHILHCDVQQLAKRIALVDVTSAPANTFHSALPVRSRGITIAALVALPPLGVYEVQPLLRTIVGALERPNGVLLTKRAAFLSLVQNLLTLCNRSLFPQLEHLRMFIFHPSDLVAHILRCLCALSREESGADVQVLQLVGALLLPRDMIDLVSARSLCQQYREIPHYAEVVAESLSILQLPLTEDALSMGEHLVPFWDAAIGTLPNEAGDAKLLAQAIGMAAERECMPAFLAFMRTRLEAASSCTSLARLYMGCAPLLRVLAAILKCQTSSRIMSAYIHEGPVLLMELLRLGCDMLLCDSSVNDLVAAMAFEVLALAAVHQQLNSLIAEALSPQMQRVVSLAASRATSAMPRPLLPRLAEALCCLYAALHQCGGGGGDSLISMLVIACGGDEGGAAALSEHLGAVIPSTQGPSASNGADGADLFAMGRSRPFGQLHGLAFDARSSRCASAGGSTCLGRATDGAAKGEAALRRKVASYHLLQENRSLCHVDLLPVKGAGGAGVPGNETCEQRYARHAECSPAVCHRGAACSNQRLRRHEWQSVQQSGDHLIAVGFIPAAALVIEACGEMFADSLDFACMLRASNIPWPPELCFLTLGERAPVALDISRAGSLARMISHSVKPNCEMQPWVVDGVPRIGVFAKHAILPGSMLTVNYSMVAIGQGTVSLPPWWPQKLTPSTSSMSGWRGASRAPPQQQQKQQQQQQQQQQLAAQQSHPSSNPPLEQTRPAPAPGQPPGMRPDARAEPAGPGSAALAAAPVLGAATLVQHSVPPALPSFIVPTVLPPEPEPEPGPPADMREVVERTLDPEGKKKRTQRNRVLIVAGVSRNKTRLYQWPARDEKALMGLVALSRRRADPLAGFLQRELRARRERHFGVAASSADAAGHAALDGARAGSRAPPTAGPDAPAEKRARVVAPSAPLPRVPQPQHGTDSLWPTLCGADAGPSGQQRNLQFGELMAWKHGQWTQLGPPLPRKPRVSHIRIARLIQLRTVQARAAMKLATRAEAGSGSAAAGSGSAAAGSAAAAQPQAPPSAAPGPPAGYAQRPPSRLSGGGAPTSAPSRPRPTPAQAQAQTPGLMHSAPGAPRGPLAGPHGHLRMGGPMPPHMPPPPPSNMPPPPFMPPYSSSHQMMRGGSNGSPHGPPSGFMAPPCYMPGGPPPPHPMHMSSMPVTVQPDRCGMGPQVVSGGIAPGNPVHHHPFGGARMRPPPYPSPPQHGAMPPHMMHQHGPMPPYGLPVPPPPPPHFQHHGGGGMPPPHAAMMMPNMMPPPQQRQQQQR